MIALSDNEGAILARDDGLDNSLLKGYNPHMNIRYAIYLPLYALFGHPRVIAELAQDAEQAGWDGVFTWDDVAGWEEDMADPTVALAAAAMATQRVRLGALITPLARRRPWKFARESASLDQLSNGRLVVGAGVGGGQEHRA